MTLANQRTPTDPTIDEYWAALAPHLPHFAPDKQRAAIVIYRELAKGRPVDDVELAAALKISPAEARGLLERDSIKAFAYADEQGRVVGFGGLATTPMHHRFDVDGCALWTWCAWDSLFIPEILDRRAHVVSPDPESGAPIRLVVTPAGIESADPASAVVSFARPEANIFASSAENVMARLCHFVFFFASRRSYERWANKHPGTFLFSLDEAFALARRMNARNFGSALSAPGNGGGDAFSRGHA